MILVAGIFAVLIATGAFFIIMPIVLRATARIFRIPQLTLRKVILLSIGFLALGSLVAPIVNLSFYVVSGKSIAEAITSHSTGSFTVGYLIVSVTAGYYLGMVLLVHHQLGESYRRSMLIAPILLIAMTIVFSVLVMIFLFLIMQRWLGG